MLLTEMEVINDKIKKLVLNQKSPRAFAESAKKDDWKTFVDVSLTNYEKNANIQKQVATPARVELRQVQQQCLPNINHPSSSSKVSCQC